MHGQPGLSSHELSIYCGLAIDQFGLGSPVPHGNASFAEIVDLFLTGKPPKPDIDSASQLGMLAACVRNFNYIFHEGHVTNEDVKMITIYPVGTETHVVQLQFEPSPRRPGRPQINRTWFFNSVMRMRMKETGKTARQTSKEVYRDYHENQKLLLRDPTIIPIGIPKPKALEHLSSKKVTRPRHVTDELIQTIDELVKASLTNSQ